MSEPMPAPLARRNPPRISLQISLLGALACLTPGHAARAQTPQPLYDETVFRTFHLSFPQPGFWQLLRRTWQTPNYVRGDLTVDGTVYRDVGVRVRGYSSASIPAGSNKLPLRISMDEYQPGQKLLGYKTLKLNNGLWDPSMVREVVGYNLYRRYIPAPKANFINLVINGKNWGVYTNVQSVDTLFTREAFGTKSGNRYEAFAQMRNWGSLATYMGYFFLRSSAPSNYADLIDVTTTYGSTSLATLQNQLPKQLAIDHFYRHLAAVMLTGHTDSGIEKDYYLYNDPFTGVFHTVPWDLNLAMRFVARPHRRQSHANVLRVTAHNERYLAHLRVMAAQSLDPAAIVRQAQGYQALIDQAVQADPNKFYTLAEFRGATTQRVFGTPSIQEHYVNLQTELGNLPGFNNVAPTLSQPGASPAQPTNQDTLTFLVTAQGSGTVQTTRVSLFLRNASEFVEMKMFDDGLHGDGGPDDDVYGVQVSPQTAGSLLDHYFAAYDGATVGYLPATAGFQPFRLEVAPLRTVLIHELMADNDNGIRDEAGEREDWLELFNPGSATVDLSGAFLTDNRTEPTKWAFPANTTLSAGQTLLVWADEEPSQGPLHASFKLSKSGEEIALYASDGRTLLDHVSFGPQQSDISTGRVEDRVSPFVTYVVPTPNAINDVWPCGIRTWSALDPTTHTMRLAAVVPTLPFQPVLGGTMRVDLAGAAPSSPVLMLFDVAPGNLPIPSLGVSLLVSGSTLLPVWNTADNRGQLSFTVGIPRRPSLAGRQLCMQGLGVTGTQVVASNGVAARFCR